MINDTVAIVSEVLCVGDTLVVVLSNYDEEEVQDYDEVVVALLDLSSYWKNSLKLDINLKFLKVYPLSHPPKIH